MGLAFWFTILPLIAALLVLVLPKLSSGVYRTLALAGGVLSLILVLVGWFAFDGAASSVQLAGRIPWFTLPGLWHGHNLAIGLSFGVDGLSLPLATMTAVIGVLSLLAVPRDRQRARENYFWLSLALTGLLGVFTSQDLFTFLVALELVLFAVFFLVYLYGDPGHKEAAVKFLIYRGFSTVAFMVALVGLAWAAAGGYATANANAGNAVFTFNIPALTATLHQAISQWLSPAAASALFLVLLLGVFIEEAFVPFHTWLPTTHEHADPSTNMLIGGVVTKTGAYVLLRFGVGMLPGEVRHWGVLLAIFGVINILYGAFAAWSSKDWRRLIAYSGISHMGLVLLGVAALNTAGLQGAMFMLISSGLLTALLFFLTGAMKDRTTTLTIRSLGGLSKSMPVLSGFLLVAALGSLGLPLTSGFISEIQAFIGGFATYPAISFVGALGVVLSAVYMLYAMERTTFGPTAEGFLKLADARPFEYVPAVVLTGLVLLVGIYPDVIGHLFGLSAQALLRIGG